MKLTAIERAVGDLWDDSDGDQPIGWKDLTVGDLRLAARAISHIRHVAGYDERTKDSSPSFRNQGAVNNLQGADYLARKIVAASR